MPIHKVKVIVTEGNKFKAIVSHDGTVVCEVIVGSKAWKEGVGKAYFTQIQIQCNKITDRLLEEYVEMFHVQLMENTIKRSDIKDCPNEATHVLMNNKPNSIALFYRWGNSPYSGGNYSHLFYLSSYNCWMGTLERNPVKFMKERLIKILD